MSALYEDVGSWKAGRRGDVESTGIFPEEVWGLVLGYIEHSEDILNVLRAFPLLDRVFQRRKSFWLVDQVLPHLITKPFEVKTKRDCIEIKFSEKKGWIPQSHELLKLRLVSKRWKKIVDKSLESNTDLGSPIPKIEKILRSLPNNQKIRKLFLTSLPSHLELNIIDFIEMLADFQFEMVNLEGFLLNVNSIAVEDEIKVAETITSLCVWDNCELTYEFLWWLPNLVSLTVHLNEEAVADAYCQSKREKFIENLSVESRLRRYCLKACDKNLGISEKYSIWEELPNLEILRGSVKVQGNSCVLGVQYWRESGNKAFGWQPDGKM